MARSYKMSWEGEKRRWVKMYKGARYRVSCEELNASLPTAEASYKLANAWWESKLAELTKPSPAEELLNRYQRADLLEKVQNIAAGQAAEQLLGAMGRSADEREPKPGSKEVIATVVREDGNYNLSGLSHLVEKAGGEPVQLDYTLSHQADRFLDVERQEARPRAPTATWPTTSSSCKRTAPYWATWTFGR